MAAFLNNRRHFIKQAGAAGLGLGLSKAEWLMTKARKEELIILHTNDVHSHIHPFSSDHPRYAGQGGAVKRANLIDAYRRNHKHVLLLDAGDIFQGTPYFNFYGGELEMKLMSQMKYDAVTLGNHDFDGGIDGLLKAKKHGKFPLLNSNYVIENTLAEAVEPYKVFKKGKVKVGVFGVGIELEGLVDPTLCKGVIYTDPVAAANKTAMLLKETLGCDYIICLSHLGLKYKEEKISDVLMARSTKHIDLIIGGHTHSFLDEPLKELNEVGQPVLVSQAAWAGLRLGVVKVTLSQTDKVSAGSSAQI
ncbi:MAG: bifunctional UDP-sugar hydrolase/5'-nucleotidase [Flavobacteriales bacterium]